MVDLLTIQTIGVIVAAFSFVVGIANNILTSRREEKRNQQNLETRQAQLFMQIYDRVNNRDFTRDWAEINYFWKWKDSKEYWEKYGRNLEVYPKFANVADTYEGIGVILQNRLIDPKQIYGILRMKPILIWEKFSPMIKEYAVQADEPMLFPGFEFLCNEMGKQYELEHGYRFVHKIRHADEIQSK